MNKLTENHFVFKCPMKWDAMATTPNGRFCGKCRKEVFDLSNCSIDEVITLQRKHGSICGSIRVATVAVSLATAACQPAATQRTTSMVAALHQKIPNDDIMMPGVICPPDQLEKSKGE